MAIYEYKCKKCEETFEKTYSLGQASKKAICPKCKKKCERIFSPPMIQFVGSGFYTNDSKTSREKDKAP